MLKMETDGPTFQISNLKKKSDLNLKLKLKIKKKNAPIFGPLCRFQIGLLMPVED
jgi:hypothetical protein